MSVKRFVAADMRRALELVRRELGDDAIILSSRRIKQGVEILTSVEPEAGRPYVSPLDTAGGEAEVAMSSDGAWEKQAGFEAAVARHRADVSEVPVAAPAPIRATTRQRGLASGKTPQELADEIEAARLKMMAAKKAEAEPRDRIEPSLNWQDANQSRPAALARSAQEYARAEAYQEQQHFSSQQPPQQPSHQNSHLEQQRRQMETLQAEIADMRLLLEDQLSRIASKSELQLTPLLGSLQRRLQRLGFSDDCIAKVLPGIREQRDITKAWHQALALLSRQLPVASRDLVAGGGVFAFVGPTGVGKTTTITKLAARYVLAHGADKVALVTTDTYRIAAHDQLRTLGRILNVQVKVVDDNDDLSGVLRSLRGCELVLIDTAGLRHGDPLLKQQLQALQQLPQVQTFLVMAANSQRQMLKATVHAYQHAGLLGCVLTKLDETASLGESLDVIIEKKLPLLYTTDGQEIPGDLELAQGHHLLTRAVSVLKNQMAESGQGA